MASESLAIPPLGHAWPMALSSFVDRPQYTVTAHCNQMGYAAANQLINLYADVGDQGTGKDFCASALFRPQPGLLMAVRYSPMPKAVAGRPYQQRFGLLLSEESFQTYCSGRFDALPDPFKDLGDKLFETLETPDHIDLEEHIQRTYGHPGKEQCDIWLKEDVKKIVELGKSTQRPRLLETYLFVLAGDASLIVHGLDESEPKRLETLLALRAYLPLEARSYLTFVTNVFQPEFIRNKATFLGLGYGLTVSNSTRSSAHTFDRASGAFVKGPDSESATKTAGNLMDALLQLPPEQYLQNTDGYLESLPVGIDAQRDKEQRFWQLGAHYRGLLVRQFGDAQSATDYLEEYSNQLPNAEQRIRVATDVLDKCVEEHSVDNLARAVRWLAANETTLTGSSSSIDLPGEVSKRMTPIIMDGTLSFAQLVGFADNVWSESKAQQDPWTDLLIELVSQSASIQRIADLGTVSQLIGPGKLLNAELNVTRFLGRTIQKTNDRDLEAVFVQSAIRSIKSTEGISVFSRELDEKKLPWHAQWLQSILGAPETIWEAVLSSFDNNDSLSQVPAISSYVSCVLSVQPDLKMPSSFWENISRQQQAGTIDARHILGLLELFLPGESPPQFQQRLDWQADTLDVLIDLIPVSNCALAAPLLEIPPSFSPAVFEKAAAIFVQGCEEEGKLLGVIQEMADSLDSVPDEDIGNTLGFIFQVSSDTDQENDGQFEPLINHALDRVKRLGQTLLLDGNIAIIANDLERYFGRNAGWLEWFESLIQHLNQRDFKNLSPKLSQLFESRSGWEYTVREGSRLWLEKLGRNTGDAEGLLKQWFSSMVDSRKLEDIEKVLPEIVRSFVQSQKNPEITKTFVSLVKSSWGEIHEIQSLFNPRDDTYLNVQRPMIIQYATQSGLRDALSDMVGYLHRHGDAGSALEKGAGAILNDLEKAIPASNPEEKERGRLKYEDLARAAIATIVLHEARAALEDKETGISIGDRRKIKKDIDRAIQDAWGSNYGDFTNSISRMLGGSGRKKGRERSDGLFPWWLDSSD